MIAQSGEVVEVEQQADGPDVILRKKELINRIVERSGMKKKDAKPVVEAMLEVLGEALNEQRDMILQPFGKLKVHRTKEFPKGQVYFTRVRQSTGV